MTTPITGRLPVPDPVLEAQESEWWKTFAEIENDFCWVQTDAVRRIIRTQYIREIISKLPSNAEILEMGCGTGWLCRMMARAGANHVLGTDFSPAQLSIAERETKAEGLDARVRFALASQPLDKRFDAVVAHGFLHHLSTEEIGLVLKQVSTYLKPSGVFILLEPFTRAHDTKPDTRFKLANWMLARLASVAHPSGKLRRTPVGERERKLRDLIAKRGWGQGGRGPSPKEIAFSSTELTQLLNPHFNIEWKAPAMMRSHSVAQEWLLLGESKPVPKPIFNTVLRLARFLDNLALSSKSPGGGAWTFEAWGCRVK